MVDVPLTDLAGTDAAIAAPHEAFQTWRAVAPGERAALLRRFAAVVDAHVDELAELEVRNAGHTWGNARWEAGNVRDCLNYYAGAPERLFGRQIPVAGGTDVTFHEPLGVVGVIVPWNFPMPIAGWGFAPALAAGNTVVLKPAELTPLTAIRLGELALEAGLPEHVLTVLPGKGSVVGERFVTHELVRKVCFTGSTEVGKRIMAGCAEQVKRVTLELGGKSANIVFADADIAAAAASAPYAVFDNAGQDCCARSRILVERSAYDEFLAGLEPSVRGAAGPRPLATSPRRWGRWSPPAQQASVQGYLDEVEVAFAGSTPDGAGCWIAAERGDRRRPGDPDLARGGVRPGRRGDAVRRRGRRGRQGQRLRVRPVRLDLHQRPRPRAAGGARRRGRQPLVNSHASVRYWTPFGGYKQSGLGRELGPDAPMAFTEEKNVFIATSGDRLQALTESQREEHGRTDPGPGRGRHRRLLGHRPGDRTAVRRGGRQGRHRRPSDDRGAEIVEELGGSDVATYVHVDVTDKDQVDALFQTAKDTYGVGRHRVQQRRHQPAGGRLDPRHRPGRVAPGPGGQPDLGLPVLQGRAPPHARAGQGLDHQHRVVRRRDGRGHLPDLLLGVQGRRAVDDPRARRAVRPRRACGSTRSARAR